MGTAGGLLRFQSNILAGSPNIILVLNADICGVSFQDLNFKVNVSYLTKILVKDLPIPDLIDELSKHKEAECVLLTTGFLFAL